LFLSFDDGYRELFDLAAPILRRLGVPATVFMTTGLVNNENWLFEDEIGLLLHRLGQLPDLQQRECRSRCLTQFGVLPEALRSVRRRPDDVLNWMWDYLELSRLDELMRYRPYLTDTMIRSMLEQGISFGAHGSSHTLVSLLPAQDQYTEITESTAWLAERFGLNYRVFAFPYGEFDIPRQTLQRVLDEGRIDLLFGTRGLVTDEFHPRLLQRVWAENHRGTLNQHLRQSLATAALRSMRGSNQVRRKT
jgi:peptidoglycan/xylan/chitin deacetylase (PgdA/CDA1 family)